MKRDDFITILRKLKNVEPSMEIVNIINMRSCEIWRVAVAGMKAEQFYKICQYYTGDYEVFCCSKVKNRNFLFDLRRYRSQTEQKDWKEKNENFLKNC